MFDPYIDFIIVASGSDNQMLRKSSGARAVPNIAARIEKVALFFVYICFCDGFFFFFFFSKIGECLAVLLSFNLFFTLRKTVKCLRPCLENFRSQKQINTTNDKATTLRRFMTDSGTSLHG